MVVSCFKKITLIVFDHFKYGNYFGCTLLVLPDTSKSKHIPQKQEQQTVTFFNVIATPELGKKYDILKRKECFYGQAKVSLHVNPLNGNLFIQDYSKTFCDQGVQFSIGYQYNSQSHTPWTINQGKKISWIEGGINELASVVYVTEADGAVSQYSYDTQRSCYVALSEAGGASVLYYKNEQWSGWNPLTNTTEQYNSNNQLQETNDANGNSLSYEYDSEGRLSAIKGNSGTRIIVEYQAHCTEVYSFDGDVKKLEMQYVFDEKNRLTQTLIPINSYDTYEVNYTYKGDTELVESITQSDLTEVDFDYIEKNYSPYVHSIRMGSKYLWSLLYQSNDTQLIDPLGKIEFFLANESGLLQKYSYLEKYQEYRYDEYHRLTQVTYQDKSTQHFGYDALGCYAELIERDGMKTLYARDEVSGLLLSETKVLLNIDGEHHLNTFYIYNDKKQLAFKIAAHGAVQAYDYDRFGNCIREITYLGMAFDLNQTTKDTVFLSEFVQSWCEKQELTDLAISEWTYNPLGSKISQTVFANIAEDGRGILDKYAAYEEYEWTLYGALRTKKTKLNENEWAIHRIEYDGLSRVVQEVDALDQITTYIYQENEQKTIFESTQLNMVKGWDSSGLLQYQKDSIEEQIKNKYFSYDKKGRLYCIEQSDRGDEYIVYDEYNRVFYTIDSIRRIVRNDYDLNNHLLHQVRYAEPLSFIDVEALINASWQPNPLGDCCIDSTFYNTAGQLLYSIDGDNYVSQHRYDNLGNRIESIYYAQPLACSATQRMAFQVAPSVIASVKDHHQRYFYNEVHHLIGEQTPSRQVIIYQRNLKGELLNKIITLASFPAIVHWNSKEFFDVSHKKQSWLLDARGQCVQKKDEESNVTDLSWDAGGRLIEHHCGDLIQVSGWDALNNLIEEQCNSGLKINKSYAPCGQVASEIKRDVIARSTPRSTYARYNGFGQVTHELSVRVALKLSDPAIAADEALVEALWQTQSIRHIYNLAGKVIRTYDELGHVSLFYYNEAQELRFSITPTGHITEYQYEGIFRQRQCLCHYEQGLAESQLIELTGGILTPELQSFFQSYRTQKDCIEWTQYNKRGLIAVLIDGERYATRKEYDAFHNIVVLEQDIDENNKLLEHRDYDELNRCILKIRDVGGIEATEHWKYVDESLLMMYWDANQHCTKTYYDKLARKIKEISPLDYVIIYSWDELSRPKTILDARSNRTTYVYKDHGRTVIESDALSCSLIKRNAFNEVEEEQHNNCVLWQKIHDVDGQIKTKIDAQGFATHYAYNIAGWLIGVIDPLKKETIHEHNKSGHVIKQIEKSFSGERVTRFQRDAQGREILRLDQQGIPIQTIYDLRGLQREQIIEPNGLALSLLHEYDGLGNSTKEIKGDSQYPDQSVSLFIRDKLGRLRYEIVDPDDLNRTTEMVYDAVGNCIGHIDPDGHASYAYFDAANNARYLIDPMGGVIGKKYNEQGYCIEERHYAHSIDTSNGAPEASQIEQMIKPDTQDRLFFYAYDAANRLIASRDDQGKLTEYRYNKQGKKSYEIQYATAIDSSQFMREKPLSTPQDRCTAWFYDARGNERFAINGEGIVSEQCWNENNWLIEKRTYATPCFSYEECPDPEALQHADDRFTRYVHDGFGRIVFEINAEGYVTQYGYDYRDKPIKTWFYPEKINIPRPCSLKAVLELLPSQEDIPCIEVKYDAAARKNGMIDQLGYHETFKLDALNNLREYIDKGGDSWTFDIDAAGRKVAESTPPVETTTVTASGQCISFPKERIVKKIEFEGDIQRITEAYGRPDARTIEVHHNPCKQITNTVHENVAVHDKSKKPKMGERTDILKTLNTTILYNAFQKPIVNIDESGVPRFQVYQGDRLLYDIDQEGYVTAYKYNVFGNVIKLTRYADAISVDFDTYTDTGIPLSVVEAAIHCSENDRSILFEFDRANRLIKTIQEDMVLYTPQSGGAARFGRFSLEKINGYNAFGELLIQRELVDPFTQQWAIKRSWFNKAGHIIAQVDELNYLTLFNPDRDGNNKKIIEYANALQQPLTEHCSIKEVLRGLIFDEENDRIYVNKMNARGERVKSIQQKVRLCDPDLDRTFSSEKQTIEQEYEYNAKGLTVKETLANGAFKIKAYDARNQLILKTQVTRQLENVRVTPVITMAYNAFGQLACLIHHKNPYENNAYLKANSEDQVHLTGFDSRGLQVVSVDPEGAMYFQAITETRKIASRWIWVSGWAVNATLIKRLHHHAYQYDKRGIEIWHNESIESGASITTQTRSNAFGEKIAQGPGDGTFPVYWLYDKRGKVWNTNEQSGVPTITLYDGSGQESVTLRSRTRSLQAIDTWAKLSTVTDLDYRHLQRMELGRNVRGEIEWQSLPAFTTLKANAPEPYALAVYSGKGDPLFGDVSLSWPIPEIAGLEVEARLWPKGRENEHISLPVLSNGTRYGINVSALTTDDYCYQIDFYYRDPQNEQRDGYPCYRAEGNAFIVTNQFAPTNNLIWHQVDAQRVMLIGNVSDVSGIELLQNGQSVGRAALSHTAQPHCWMIDLGDKPSGRYEFRLLRGYSLVEAQPMRIGSVSSQGTRMDDMATTLTQLMHLYPETNKGIVTTTWNNLPPQISALYHELVIINAESAVHPQTSVFTTYSAQTQVLAVANKAGTTSLYATNALAYGLHSFFRFSSSIVSNRLYAVDAHNQKKRVVDVINPLTGINSNNHFVYVQPGNNLSQVDALREHASQGQAAKTIALQHWLNTVSRCDASFINRNAYYDLISLRTSMPDIAPCGEITIHTANTQSNHLIVREVALVSPMMSKVKCTMNNKFSGHDRRLGLNFKWELPDFLAHVPMKVNVTLNFTDQVYKAAYGGTYTFQYMVGPGSQLPYNGHLLPLNGFIQNHNPAFNDFKLAHLTMAVHFNDEWVPLLNSNVFSVNNNVYSYPASTVIPVTIGKTTSNFVITSYQEAHKATFSDTYTLLFYPLPQGIKASSIILEYCDRSLLTPVWRTLANTCYTGRSLSAPANGIMPGVYQYRIKAKNTQGQDIDFSAVAEQMHEGWALGHFSVTHGGRLTSVHHSATDLARLRPIRKQSFDRWGNLITSKNTLGHETHTYYNARNKPVKKVEALIEVTDSHGQMTKTTPTTYTVYDNTDQVIAFIDANRHVTTHERDKDGTLLKTTLADKVFKRFILDIFGRTAKIRDPFDKDIQHQYDRCNRELLHLDGCQWDTSYTYNERGNRLSVTNGNKERERYDYLHPSQQATHHYLPAGEQYTTIRDYERHGVLIAEQLADGRMNTWAVDAFGNIMTHVDLSGARYTYTLNPFFPSEVVHIHGDNAAHGVRTSPNGSKVAMPNQDVTYQYDEASHLVGILDNALPLTTLYRVDSEGRRVRETFIDSEGHIHQAVCMSWNALGWLTQVRDTAMQVKYAFDPEGNRRSTIASVFWDNRWHPIGTENWYAYTEANNIQISQGKLVNGNIQIVPNQGTMLTYDKGGRRKEERTIKSDGKVVDKSLFYLDNYLLSGTQNSLHEEHHFRYDNKVGRRKEFRTNHSEQISDYHVNGWLEKESRLDREQKFIATTTYQLNVLGIPSSQETKVRATDVVDGYEDQFILSYVAYDNDKIIKADGTRKRLNGETTHATLNTSYDPNGNMECVVGDNQEVRRFITNSNNRIVLATVGQHQRERYFYTTSDQPLGRFGNIPRGPLKQELTDIDFDLNFHPVSEHFPPPTPGSCTVLKGDSFSSIAERMYGDRSFANLIAEENGYRQEETPPVGLSLRIPNVVNTNLHNWAGQYSVYNPGAIIGSLYPNMPMPQRVVNAHRKHHRFWHVLLEAVAGSAILAFAPEFSNMFSVLFNELLGELLGFSLAGAASNFVEQELARGFGDRQGVSLSAIGQSALLSVGSAGIAKALGINLMKGPHHRNALDAVVKNIELSIATQGLSFAVGQQRHFDWRIMLASVGNAMANAGSKQIDFSTPFFNDVLATASSSVASIGIDKMLGTAIDADAIAANTLGTYIGNQLAAQAKQHYAEYQAKQVMAGERGVSEIPEISQTLAQSERHFLESIRVHPSKLGRIETPASAPRHEPSRSHSTKKEVNGHKPAHGASGLPNQPHLKAERAKEEALLIQSAQRNKASSQTTRASQSGFWRKVERINNSKVLKVINDTGDAVAHTVLEMINPVTLVENAWDDSHASVQAYREGHVLRGMALTGKTALDLLGLVPLEGLAVKGVQYGTRGVSAVGSRLGFFGRGAEGVSEIGISSHDAIGRLQLEKLRTQYRQEASWVDPTEIQHTKFQQVVGGLYRPNAKIGSGSSADGVRYELANPGTKINGQAHFQKVNENIKLMEQFIKGGKLSPHETMIAENIRLDMLDALGEKLWYSQTTIPKY